MGDMRDGVINMHEDAWRASEVQRCEVQRREGIESRARQKSLFRHEISRKSNPIQ